MKKLLMGLMCVMLFISFTSAISDSIGAISPGETIRLRQVCVDSTYINISSIIYPNSSIAANNLEMVSFGSGEFYYDFNDTETFGEYYFNGISDGCDGTFSVKFYVTSNGSEANLQQTIIYIFLILFFIGLIYSFYSVSSKMDYDRWYNSILNKYQSKNSPKVIFSGMLYSFVKEAFVTYYLLSFPIIILFKGLVETFGTSSIQLFMETMLILYALGLAIVGILFFGKMQEFVMRIVEDAKNMNWGINK